MKNATTGKFAVLSHVLPPSYSGQAVVLYRLLEKIPSENYILVSNQDLSGFNQESRSAKKLEARYYSFDSKRKKGPFARFFLRIPLTHRLTSFISGEQYRLGELKKILTSEHCQTLVVCTGGFFDIPIGYLAAKKLKIRFIVYSFDDYVYQWTGILRAMARMISKKAFKAADRLIVPNEFLQKEYLRRYGKRSVIVRNPYKKFTIVKTKTLFKRKEINIIYTGSVYFAHFDAFRNLVAAMKLIREPVKLHIFTGQPKDRLQAEGIVGNQVEFHDNLNQKDVYMVQNQANILFLPLAFNSPINETIRTSAPGKMGEYLASGRPVLVHAPSDSFVSWYFKVNKAGFVADQLDPKLLARKISESISHKEKTKKYIANAKVCAKTDFSIDIARRNFLGAIKFRARILLVSPVLPNRISSGAIMLTDLVSLVKEDQIYFFAARDPLIKKISALALPAVVKYKSIKRPIESPYRFPNWFFDRPASLFIEKLKNPYLKIITRQAIRFGRKNQVDFVWLILQGKTMIASALEISKKLRVPLACQIWDEPEWILSNPLISSKDRSEIIKKFDQTIRKCAVCAVASDGMAKKYRKKLSSPPVVFLGSLDKKTALKTATKTTGKQDFKIGFAGQLYASKEFEALIVALEDIGFKINGKKVKIFLLGSFNADVYDSRFKDKITILGYKSQKESIRILSQMDILYCPYWFDKEYKNIAKTSFPSKLATYFAAGRPVFFHGPSYSSPAKFIKENRCGILCHSLKREKIISQLRELSSDQKKYGEITRAGREAFDKYLTYDNLSSQLTLFLNKAKESISR